MELIKSFVKYSKSYRNCSDFYTKKQIYNKWIDDTTKTTHESAIVDRLIASSFTLTTVAARRSDSVDEDSGAASCEFCYAAASFTTFMCCDKCLYPFCKRIMDEELATYSLLSVCFYEENEMEILKDACSITKYVVWSQRLRFTWQLHQNSNDKNKFYKIVHKKCIQCNRRTSLLGFTTQTFNLNLFCQQCMFPLFCIENFAYCTNLAQCEN
ncbi:ac52 [Artaxa digramma nucleopolyhedrovirus]|uniref:Ac52 n=1 Tax=Artaxa digramma nucleopolyhedrovirus TaxID=3070910 RepID=A0AAE6R5X6_9ABAC|nr:ac52 [Euproctis digramma nucleopolyhedrovirus]QHB21687.1 ac52 [Artaxa digramma nucleopolyhedrovirus]